LLYTDTLCSQRIVILGIRLFERRETKTDEFDAFKAIVNRHAGRGRKTITERRLCIGFQFYLGTTRHPYVQLDPATAIGCSTLSASAVQNIVNGNRDSLQRWLTGIPIPIFVGIEKGVTLADPHTIRATSNQ
jgi:hypothetical protein